jgi:ketosteroid isomerase-like protein
MPSPEQAVRAYFQALESGSYDRLMALFSKFALVDSPLYGRMQASEFFKDLLQDTAKSKLTVLSIFENREKPGSIAAHYNYQWILKNSKFTNFEGVDVFSVSPAGKIDRLSIFYDTSKVRGAWGKGRK